MFRFVVAVNYGIQIKTRSCIKQNPGIAKFSITFFICVQHCSSGQAEALRDPDVQRDTFKEFGKLTTSERGLENVIL